MVDYNAALPQLTPYQAPNVLAMAEMANKMQLHQAQLAEVQRTANEQNQLRALLESGVDRNSPEFFKQVYRISPTTGMTLEKGQSELRNAELTRRKTEGELARQPIDLQTSKAEAAAKTLAFHRETAPIVKDQATYDIWRANLLKDAPQLAAEVDPVYSPEGMQRLIMTHDASTKEYAAQAAEQRLQARPQIQTIKNADGSESLVRVAPGVGASTPVPGGTGAPKPADVWTDTDSGRRFQPIRNANGEVIGQREVTPGAIQPPAGNAPAAAAGASAPFAAPVNAPAAVMRQPAAAPVVGDAYSRNLDAAEGRDKNFRSTAQGFGQFLNGTFVDTAKKVFPELANKSPAEILTLRGTKLADGTPIEAVLEQKFRTDNIASLTSAGIQPTPGNVYLAHFLSAGGARNVLSADPNTPLSQVVSADAIKANPEVLALKNKTVGDLQNWANSKFGSQPGLAASMTAGNARLGGAPTGFVPAGGVPMSPGAPTVNNALMANMFGAAPPQNAMLSLQPQIPGAPTPAAAMAPAVAAAPVVAPAPAAKPPVLADISPKEQERRDASQATAIRQYIAAQQALDEQIKNVQELKTHPGLSGMTGSFAGHPYVPNLAQDTVNAQELLTSITEKGKLEELLNLKAMGGSLGPVAVSEGEGLKKAHGVLGQRQDTKTFTGRVGQLESKLTAAKSALKDAFEQQYAYRGIPAPDVPAMPTVKMPESAAPAEMVETGVARNEKGRRGTLNAVPNRPPLTFFGGG
jgi:hypothetical protein